MIRILRHYIQQNKGPTPALDARSCTTAVRAMWSHSSGGIFDKAASSSEGSLLVDIVVIMLRLDAIMHCVSWLHSAVIYGQPVLCYRSTPWDEWEWI